MKKCFLILLILYFLTGFAQETVSMPDEYYLQKGDRLSIEVMDHPEFTKQVQILPDGTIEYPILGNLRVVGMTATELGDIIKENLQPYVPIPIVTVYVTKIYGQNINIIGYVNNPGNYQIFEALDIPDALARAGGIKNIRKVKYVKIIRKNGDVINIKLASLWFSENINENPQNRLKLEEGDTLIVPPPVEFNWAIVSALVSIINISLTIYTMFAQ
ncbi:MAG: hypothetical protein B6D62_03530 [Candidatus Cloacimonas sp. 4484_275]|nr:MAG: hypothetical protein B6D62_03530 [Candidatus Cloacimonas sp. 4484_275]RLC51834.1 MAG: hypothetical protein DRZ79_02150 [Candidatus Cloacimonadota bacterium]